VFHNKVASLFGSTSQIYWRLMSPVTPSGLLEMYWYFTRSGYIHPFFSLRWKMNFMISLMDTAFLQNYKTPRPSNLRIHHQWEPKISKTRVTAGDKMGTARSTLEDEKFIWNVRRQISANEPLGRRGCRWHDTLTFSVRMMSGRHLNWVVTIRHINTTRLNAVLS